MIIHLPDPVWASICTVFGGIVVYFLGERTRKIDREFQEKSRLSDREFNEKSKQIDRDMTERYKQIEREAAERARQFDIYKVVYPEKVKTAATLMQQADSLFQITHYAATCGDPTDESLKAEVLEKATKLHELSTAAEWLLGSEVKAQGIQLVVAARTVYSSYPDGREQVYTDWLSTEPQQGGNGKYHALYASMGQSVRQQLHLNTLNKLLSDSNEVSVPLTEAVIRDDKPQVLISQ